MIDVTGWRLDSEHGIFPVGARDKEMLWSPSDRREGIKPDWPYLFKESIKYYPDQFWIEIIAYIVGKHLGVNVPVTLPAVKHTDDGPLYGSLSQWFYDLKNNEQFEAAGSHFKRINSEFDDKQGKQHNFHDLVLTLRYWRLTRGLTDKLGAWLVDLVLFDVLIGNTDRHQENWGIIFKNDGSSSLAPLFDNGTSLGHERFMKHVRGWNDDKIRAYLNKGYHHLRYRREEPDIRIPHFQFIAVLARTDAYKEQMSAKLSRLNVQEMFREIEELQTIECDIPLTQERCEWIFKLLRLRIELIEEKLQ